LPKANEFSNLSLAKTGFIDVVNYFTIFRTEAAVFFAFSQLFAKPA
jgi:hypothetical protein